MTAVEQIDDITIHMASPEKKDKLLSDNVLPLTLVGQHHALHAIKFNQLIMRKSFSLAKTAK